MANDKKTASNALMRIFCIIAPPSLFLAIRLTNVLETWKYEIAGCIVLAWSVAIGHRMLITRRCGIHRLYKRAFSASLIEHAIVLGLATLVLDGGYILYDCILASMLYWMIAGVVVARRPTMPTAIDVSLVAHGFLLLAVAVVLIFFRTVAVRGH
jgi:hypothetical protein